jgi:shikimate kinase
MTDDEPPLSIALVGPCASGKSTLGDALREIGYYVRQPSQEHSHVADMWQRRTKPDVLIYLDLDFESLKQRRPKTHGGPSRLAEQHQRLTHAYQHCDLYIDTSDLTPGDILKKVFEFLKDQ